MISVAVLLKVWMKSNLWRWLQTTFQLLIQVLVFAVLSQRQPDSTTEFSLVSHVSSGHILEKARVRKKCGVEMCSRHCGFSRPTRNKNLMLRHSDRGSCTVKARLIKNQSKRQRCHYYYYITSVHPGGEEPPLLPSWMFSPFFLFLGSFSWSDVRSWDRDVVNINLIYWRDRNV